MRVPGWIPVLILALGCVLMLGGRPQLATPLRVPLESVIPRVIAGADAADVAVTEEERSIAGMTDYIFRTYTRESLAPEQSAAWSVYVGYYDRQARGRTIHSPRNCLPGGGWEALSAAQAELITPHGPVTVNRYLLHRRGENALVLYWYQGRGRVEANEYKVKLNLMRDALLHRRTEEALVRVVIPVTASEAEAFAQAKQVAAVLVPALSRALPT